MKGGNRGKYRTGRLQTPFMIVSSHMAGTRTEPGDGKIMGKWSRRVWYPMYEYLCYHMTSPGPVGISDKIISNFLSLKEQLQPIELAPQ